MNRKSVEFQIAAARWPADTAEAHRLLTHYGQHLAASPSGSAGICVVGYAEELGRLEARYGAAGADLLLARVNGEAAGCVAIAGRVLNDGTPAAEMKRLWVEPGFRGLSLGRGLVPGALEWARTHGYVAVVLDTVNEAMPEAGSLYRSLGFQPIERFNDNPVPGIQFYMLKLSPGSGAA